ncbi:MAG: hypothetical protein PHP98_04465 [Kiritimatiellae bacterium]|jgi:hypothetical protein|nr:hypothetical protein [Kiritimatiellia bacterium]
MTQLNQEQKELVRQWVTAGATLPEIQKKIKEELKIPVTFMETRFLVLDLNLDIKEKTPAAPADIDLSKPSSAGAEDEVPEEKAAPGGVSVELDRVVKAGAIVSGKVTFSDGETAAWSLDQFGRLALSAGNAGYRPSQDDLQAFQQELARLIQNRGF